jgi:hypothetical protein
MLDTLDIAKVGPDAETWEEGGQEDPHRHDAAKRRPPAPSARSSMRSPRNSNRASIARSIPQRRWRRRRCTG